MNINISIRAVRFNVRGNKADKEMLSVGLRAVMHLFLAVASMILLTSCDTDSETSWEEKVSNIVWVAYSPPTADPEKGIEAAPESIREDLTVLRRAGFTGLVTYSSSGVLGRELPTLAQSQGFQGLIMGIWDPSNQEEIAAAEAAAEFPIVLGFCVGNEGLQKRYEMPALSATIKDLREKTGKPVATTEEIDDYSDENLLQLGDWVFPNTHPYFHNQLDPDAAVRWTQAAYDDFKRRTDRFVLFKEVGLPTAGDSEGKLSETNQERYYQELVG
jgi:exo-beta-1,3-glucanase (GH17 family)